MRYVFYPSKVTHFLAGKRLDDVKFDSFGLVLEWPNGDIVNGELLLNKNAEAVVKLKSTLYSYIDYDADGRSFTNVNCYNAVAIKAHKYDQPDELMDYTFLYHSAGQKVDFIAIESVGRHEGVDGRSKEVFYFYA